MLALDELVNALRHWAVLHRLDLVTGNRPPGFANAVAVSDVEQLQEAEVGHLSRFFRPEQRG